MNKYSSSIGYSTAHKTSAEVHPKTSHLSKQPYPYSHSIIFSTSTCLQ